MENKIPWVHTVMQYVVQAYGYVTVIVVTSFCDLKETYIILYLASESDFPSTL